MKHAIKYKEHQKTTSEKRHGQYAYEVNERYWLDTSPVKYIDNEVGDWNVSSQNASNHLKEVPSNVTPSNIGCPKMEGKYACFRLHIFEHMCGVGGKKKSEI